MPAVALSRVGARVVESGPDGVSLAEDTWARLERLRAPACSVIVRVCHSGPCRWRASVGLVWSRRPSGTCR